MNLNSANAVSKFRGCVVCRAERPGAPSDDPDVHLAEHDASRDVRHDFPDVKHVGSDVVVGGLPAALHAVDGGWFAAPRAAGVGFGRAISRRQAPRSKR